MFFLRKQTLAHGLGLWLLALAPLAPGQAAERLTLRIGGLELPLELQQLEDWVQHPQRNRELGPWLNLLEPSTRRDLLRLLRQPLPLQGNSIGPLLDSWAGQQLVQQLGTLLRPPEQEGGPLLLDLLRQNNNINALALLRAAPTPSLRLDLDAITELGYRLRSQLQRQLALQRSLRALELPPVPPEPEVLGPVAHQKLHLAVAHRPRALPLELWWPQGLPFRRHWVLLSHGLGGSSDQLGWWAKGLAAQGWPVLVVQHSGSDGEAVRGLLEGRQRLPGMETLPDRLLDLQAVTAALESGRLSFGPSSAPQRFVLAGHSLGGLSDLLWAGAELQPGLDQRCQRALRSIPVLDSSFLLQCQLTAIPLAPLSPPPQLDGLMVLNGFGSLLWADQGLRPLTLPVLMVGGSLDLITPPATEQLEPFRQLQNSNSRLALVEGASHFSPVRLEREQPLMQFGEDLVGKDPLQVQALLLDLQSRFLRSLEAGTPAPVGQFSAGKVRAFVLDRSLVNRLHF